MIIIDIIIIGIIISSFLYGYKKGLVNIITTLVGFVLALILAFIFSNSVALYVKNNTPLYGEIKTSVTATLNAFTSKDTEDAEKQEIEEEKNDTIISSFKEDIINTADEKKSEKIQEYSEKISMYILKSLSFMAIYILVITIASILNMMLNGIFSLPLLDSVNKISGMIANGLVTLLKIQIILAIIYVVSGISIMNGIVKVINETTFLNVLYNNNIIVGIIQTFFK